MGDLARRVLFGISGIGSVERQRAGKGWAGACDAQLGNVAVLRPLLIPFSCVPFRWTIRRLTGVQLPKTRRCRPDELWLVSAGCSCLHHTSWDHFFPEADGLPV